MRRVRVSADGAGVVSHAGVGLLREVADLSGLTEHVTTALADTYKGPWVHDPGRVFTDLAAAVADGADCVSGIGALVDQQVQHGPVASLTTTWRLLDRRVDVAHLTAVKAARVSARAADGAPMADRPEIAGGEALAGKLRPGNAGSGTTCDHVEVLTEALASIPEGYGHDLATRTVPRCWSGPTPPVPLMVSPSSAGNKGSGSP